MSPAARTVPRETARAETAAAPDAARPPYLAALGAAAVVFALYAFTLGPTTWFWDTSEYIATGHIVGIPHPPGNPLFVLLARAWDVLLSPTGLPVAVRINLFSAFMTAGTMFFWYLLVHRILGYFDVPERVRRVGAFVAVFLSSTAYTVWSQATVNEKVYTVSLFTIAALSWIAFLWRDHVEEHRLVRGPSRWHDDNAILLMVFILALSVANHLMAALAFPALLTLVLMVKPRTLLNWRLYALGAVFAIVGISVHLFLPLRSGLHPIINEAAPTCPTVGSGFLSVLGFGQIRFPGDCADLYAALAREQYQKPPLFPRLSDFHDQLLVYFQYFDWQWGRAISGAQGYFGQGRIFVTLLFLALGIHGAIEHFRRDRKSFWYVALLFGMLAFGLVVYMNFRYGYGQALARNMDPNNAEVRERDYFFLVSFSVWGLWAGIGLVALWATLADALEGRRRRWLLGAPVLAVALIPLFANWSYASRRGDYSARDLAYNMLQSVEPYGVLFTNGDNDTFPLWYLQEVEGVRRDVTVIVMSYLNTDWYARQVRDLTQPCPRPGAWKEDVTRIICQRDYEAGGVRLYQPKTPTRSILPLTDEQIDAVAMRAPYYLADNMAFQARGIQAVLEKGHVFYPADEFVLNIVNAAWGDRPIHFAATTYTHYELGFGPHVERRGLTFKLVTPQEAAASGAVPMPTGGNFSVILGAYQNPDFTRRLMDEVWQLHGLTEKAHWTDAATRNIPMQYVYAYQAQAAALQMKGDQAGAEKYVRLADAFEGLANR